MMCSNKDIFGFLCGIFPLELQMDFDNSGFLVGRSDAAVNKVLLALDVTPEVIEEAHDNGATLIISHHPIIFEPVKALTDEKLLKLTEYGIAVISMHTNMDIGDGGVNDVLISAFKAKEVSCLCADGCGRVGTLDKKLAMREFLPLCKELLHSRGLRYHDAGRPVEKLAVMGGAGGSSIMEAFEKGCDTYLTADIKYSSFLLAKELGINLVDGDHFCTENLVIPMLAQRLRDSFNEIDFHVSQKHEQTAMFF